MEPPPTERPLTLRVWGNYRILTATGLDIAPKGMKERGLISILALSRDQRRSRDYLQDKLWSTKEATQAQTSLRRALSNIRKTDPALEDVICADRADVWLRPARWCVETTRDPPDVELLENLRIRDPEFESWCRDQQARLVDSARAPTRQAPYMTRTEQAEPEPRFDIVMIGAPASDKERFAREYLACILQRRLRELGPTTICEEPRPDAANADRIELRSHIEGRNWVVLLRLVSGPLRACHWSGHATLPFTMTAMQGSDHLSTLVAQAFAATLAVLSSASSAPPPPRLQLQKASQLLFSGAPDKIDRAETMLCTLPDMGISRAWRAFGRLTRAIEFQEIDPDLAAEGLQLANDALTDPPNATVSALAAIVAMKLDGDIDFGFHLAQAAIAVDDQNPYALNALSQAHFFRGDFAEGFEQARRAKLAAIGLPNSYYWDMQACLSALGVGQFEAAIGYARESYLRWPRCRPPLRYLVALHQLSGDTETAATYAAQLKRLEPSFTLASLSDPAYPVETLRRLGLLQAAQTP
jgi:tetratricopeptide (TPR) repeat protein